MLGVYGLHLSYGQRRVLEGVNLEVHPGEIVGLVGPNGCGKTSLIRAVTRLTPVAGGRVEVGGKDIERLSRRELARQVAVVSQGQDLPAGYRVFDVVLLGRTAHLGFFSQEGARDHAVAEASLGRVDALQLRDRLVDELSGGERQRVMIARALAQESKLLLLDEPTANLDISYQATIAALLRQLSHDDGLAVLTTLHDLPLAALYCDRVALLCEGRIIADGPPADVLTPDRLARAYGMPVRIIDLDGVPLALPLRAKP